MKEEIQEVFFNKLIEELIEHIGYYLPKTIIPDKALEELEGKINSLFFDELSVLDLHYGIGAFEVLEFNLLQQKKRNKLERNIFKLVKKKSELEAFEFAYILEKYWDQLNFFVYIAYWLKTNLSKYHKTKMELTLIGSFEMQYHLYLTHSNEFKRRFKGIIEFREKSNFTAIEIVQDYMQNLITRYSLATDKNTPPEKTNLAQTATKNTATKSEKKSVKTKKVPLLTEKEIEDFLLESVFNIKTDN